MNWPTGQLTTSRSDEESAAQEAGSALSSVAYVGSAIGGPGSPSVAATGKAFFTVFRSDLEGATQQHIMSWEWWGNVPDFDKPTSAPRPKRSIPEGLAILRMMREQSSAKDQEKLEREWLAKHRSEYAGQWIALLGDRLISHSANASDVFSAARAAGVKALVLRVDDSELRFAGW